MFDGVIPIPENFPLAGAAAANCGGSVTLRPGRSETILELKSGDASGVNLAVVIGVETKGADGRSYDKTEHNLEPEFLISSVRVALSWGIGNTGFDAECDAINGTQLAIAAENLRVVAKYVTVDRPWDPTPPELLCQQPQFEVSAGLAYTGIGRNSNPARLTEVVQIENPGERCLIKVPPFAISMTVLPVDGGAARVRLMALGTGYSVRYDVVSPLSNAGQYNVENAVPIFNGARFVEVENISPTGPLSAIVVFGLAL